MTGMPVRERTLAGLLVVAVASLLFLLFALLPMRTQAHRLTQSLAAQRRQLREQELLRHSLPRLRQQAADLRAQIAVLSRPNANPTPEVVREIDRLTGEQGLEWTSIHPGEPEYLDSGVKYTTSFDARASFDQIVRLLHKLEASPHFLWVEGVTISGERTGSVLTLNATVAVCTSRSASTPSHAQN